MHRKSLGGPRKRRGRVEATGGVPQGRDPWPPRSTSEGSQLALCSASAWLGWAGLGLGLAGFLSFRFDFGLALGSDFELISAGFGFGLDLAFIHFDFGWIWLSFPKILVYL